MRAQCPAVEHQLKVVIAEECGGDGHQDKCQGQREDDRDSDRDAAGRIEVYSVRRGGLDEIRNEFLDIFVQLFDQRADQCKNDQCATVGEANANHVAPVKAEQAGSLRFCLRLVLLLIRQRTADSRAQ